MFPFVDISEDQGVYNMAANNDQIIAIRMSTGADGLRFDTQAANNYKNAASAGKLILQYHYCGNNDPTTEANLFISACSPFAQYDMYCIDAELGQTKEWKQTFASVVKAATGCNVIDYMNISLTNSLGTLSDCGLWLAAPSWGFNQTITELNPGITYILQQGPIANGVDSDMCFIDLDTLKKYGFQGSPASTPIVSPPSNPVPISAPVPTTAPAATTEPPSAPSSTPTTVSTPVVAISPSSPEPIENSATSDPKQNSSTNTPIEQDKASTLTSVSPPSINSPSILSWWHTLLKWLGL